ncbi:MAG TPA: DoxX family membrane protein [Pyrinomonadaceae bacterium]
MHGRSALDRAHARVRRARLLRIFTVFTRILLALGFIPSGITKVLGNRFTILDLDNPVGFFFEAMYRTGFYWRFLGLCQLAAALLLLIPRTATIGALVYFPLILNIFVITVSLDFRGTPFITGLMLLANIYLLCWDYDKLKHLIK